MIGGTGSAEVGTGLFLMVIGQSQYGVFMPVYIEERKVEIWLGVTDPSPTPRL